MHVAGKQCGGPGGCQLCADAAAAAVAALPAAVGEVMAELEQLRAIVAQLNPAGHSLRHLVLEDARRRDFIDRLQAEAEQLRAGAAADHEASRVAAGLPKSWAMFGQRCHFVGMLASPEGEPLVVCRAWRRSARGWVYETKPLWLLHATLRQAKAVAHG